MITAVRDDQASKNPAAIAHADVVEALASFVSSVQLYRSVDGRLYAEVPTCGRHEIIELLSSEFRDWFVYDWSVKHGFVPSPWVMRDTVRMLEDRARFDPSVPSLFVRVGAPGVGAGEKERAAYYVDLGDADSRAIKICGEGWMVVDRPVVRFRRPLGQMPLPIPSLVGSILLLKQYVNLSEPDFRQLVVWLTAALRPAGPCPILAVYGEQGSAKSSLARLVRLLVDPQDTPLLPQPRNLRELMTTAVNCWLLAYDNINTIPDWLSDSLCRLADGGGFAARPQLSGAERQVITAQRPAVINGIGDFVRQADLVDRCVFLRLPQILPAARRTQAEYWRSFQRDYPRILGGLLDAVAGGMRVLPKLELPAVPRMADFAYWGEAVGRGLGWPPETFLTLYRHNRLQVTEDSLENSVLSSALLRFGKTEKWWQGAPADLYRILTAQLDGETASSQAWPKTPSWLSRELHRIAPRLRTQGISLTFGKKFDQRWIAIAPEQGRPRYPIQLDDIDPYTAELDPDRADDDRS